VPGHIGRRGFFFEPAATASAKELMPETAPPGAVDQHQDGADVGIGQRRAVVVLSIVTDVAPDISVIMLARGKIGPVIGIIATPSIRKARCAPASFCAPGPAIS
jgi:hypothetical protein